MLSETIKKNLSDAAKAVSLEPNDPLMKQMLMPAERAELAFQSMFRSMAYFLKYKVNAAKENEIKKFGVYIKSLDQFIMGAYISVIDNDGEDSVSLDFTFDPDQFKDIIDNGYAVTIDDPAFTPYVSASTTHVPGANGENLSFYIMPEYVHTVYVLTASILKSYIEELLDDSSSDKTVTLEGVFVATGSLDNNGEKVVSVEADETIKQIIKDDDANEVAA